MKTKTEHWLISCHTDEELTKFLQDKAESGLYLAEAKGNKLIFSEKPYTGRKICACTITQEDAEIPITEQIRKTLPELRKNGWDLICIAGPETIADTQRHVFLYEETPGSQIPRLENEDLEKISKNRVKKITSNLILGIIYLITSISLLFLGKLNIFTNIISLGLLLIFTILLFISLLFSIRSIIDFRNREKTWGLYSISLEKSTYSTFLMLIVLACLLLFS